MACILVYIESDEERIRDISLQALGAGRRIASTMGATLCAFIQTSVSAVAADRWVQALGQAGADKVVVVANAPATGPARWFNQGETLYAVCSRLRPVMTLLASSPAGRDIAPRLAARLGGDHVAETYVDIVLAGQSIASPIEIDSLLDAERADDEAVDRRRLDTAPPLDIEGDTAAHATVEQWDTAVLTRSLAATGHERRIALTDLRPGSVVVLRPAAYPRVRGSDDADAMHMPFAELRPNAPTYLDSTAAPDADLTTARVIVSGGGGVASAEVYRLLRDLADALGGRVAATATLCDRGVAPTRDAVGMQHHRIAPELYISCGASGSPEHLGGIAPRTTIVAVNRDADAAIFKSATYGIVGDIEDVVPSLIAAVKERSASGGEASRSSSDKGGSR